MPSEELSILFNCDWNSDALSWSSQLSKESIVLAIDLIEETISLLEASIDSWVLTKLVWASWSSLLSEFNTLATSLLRKSNCLPSNSRVIFWPSADCL